MEKTTYGIEFHVIARLFTALLITFFLCGCVSTDSSSMTNASQRNIMAEPLLEATLTDAMSCWKAGVQRRNMAWKCHLAGDSKRAKQLLKEAISLLKQAFVLRKQLDALAARRACCQFARACEEASLIYADEPEFCQGIYVKAIHQINVLLNETPGEKSMRQDLEYYLSMMYFFVGDEEKAFQAADSAWIHGLRNWSDDMRNRLRDCMEIKKMEPYYLPPPKPRPTLSSKLLFPINVIPDVLCDTVYCVGFGIFCIGGLLVSDEPGWGFMALCYLPFTMPVYGCVVGVDDAWRGIPFWKLAPWKEKF